MSLMMLILLRLITSAKQHRFHAVQFYIPLQLSSFITLLLYSYLFTNCRCYVSRKYGQPVSIQQTAWTTELDFITGQQCCIIHGPTHLQIIIHVQHYHLVKVIVQQHLYQSGVNVPTHFITTFVCTIWLAKVLSSFCNSLCCAKFHVTLNY